MSVNKGQSGKIWQLRVSCAVICAGATAVQLPWQQGKVCSRLLPKVDHLHLRSELLRRQDHLSAALKALIGTPALERLCHVVSDACRRSYSAAAGRMQARPA